MQWAPGGDRADLTGPSLEGGCGRSREVWAGSMCAHAHERGAQPLCMIRVFQRQRSAITGDELPMHGRSMSTAPFVTIGRSRDLARRMLRPLHILRCRADTSAFGRGEAYSYQEQQDQEQEEPQAQAPINVRTCSLQSLGGY